MLADFVNTPRTRAELRTALDVIREFKGHESPEEYVDIWLSQWKMLEVLEDWLAHMVEEDDRP